MCSSSYLYTLFGFIFWLIIFYLLIYLSNSVSYPPSAIRLSHPHWSNSHCNNINKMNPTIEIEMVPWKDENGEEVIDPKKWPDYLRLTHYKSSGWTMDEEMPPVLIKIPNAPGFIPPNFHIFPEVIECREKQPGYIFNCQIKCPVPCNVTTIVSESKDADAVMQLLEKEKDVDFLDDQIKIMFYSEPYVDYLSNSEKMKKFDLVMHWHRSSHIKLMSHDNKYFDKDEVQFDEPGFPYRNNGLEIIKCSPSSGNDTDPYSIISFINGNCVRLRSDLIVSLQDHLYVTSYGSCLRNRVQPEGERYEKKINVQSQHKFCFAAENLFGHDDWVTEKPFQSLASGCVPVYFGAPNIEEYLPCDNCIIKGSDFKDMGELAKYLIYLDQNPREYQKYLEYKNKPLKVKPLLLSSKRFSFCASCIAVSKMKKTGERPPKLVWSVEKRKFVNLYN